MPALQEVQYSDLDLDLTPHPVTGDIVVKTGTASIDQALRSIVYTNFFERPFHSDIGANLRAQMFEPFSPITIKSIERNLVRAISNDDVRVRVLKLVIDERRDQNGVRVTLTYRPVNGSIPVTVAAFLKRLR